MFIIHHADFVPFIKQYIPASAVIVEVGAFTGHDTARLVRAFPDAHIFAFEPVVELYQKLVATVAPYPHVKTYCAAVSDHDGTATLHRAHKKSGAITQASSLQKPKERLKHSPITFPDIITVPTMQLTTWAKQEQITHIDLLWLDTQGHEMIILESIRTTLLPHISYIYTEVGFVEAYEGQQHAHTVLAWLAREGFEPLAQDFTNPPTWFFGNILFVRK